MLLSSRKGFSMFCAHSENSQGKKHSLMDHLNLFAAELLRPMGGRSRIEHENEGSSQQHLMVAVMHRVGVCRSVAAIRVEELRLGMVEQSLF
jgi:hypothetical protein